MEVIKMEEMKSDRQIVDNRWSALQQLTKILLVYAVIVFVLFILLFVKVQLLAGKVADMQEVMSDQISLTKYQLKLNDDILNVMRVLIEEGDK
jgi:hypothetical protein